MPLRASVWERTTSTPCTAPEACLAIRMARATMVITIAAATITTTTPRISPMVHPLEAPIAMGTSHLLLRVAHSVSLCRPADRPHDRRVARAAADLAGDRLPDLPVRQVLE